jgi:hypothetical protein
VARSSTTTTWSTGKKCNTKQVHTSPGRSELTLILQWLTRLYHHNAYVNQVASQQSHTYLHMQTGLLMGPTPHSGQWHWVCTRGWRCMWVDWLGRSLMCCQSHFLGQGSQQATRLANLHWHCSHFAAQHPEHSALSWCCCCQETQPQPAAVRAAGERADYQAGQLPLLPGPLTSPRHWQGSCLEAAHAQLRPGLRAL